MPKKLKEVNLKRRIKIVGITKELLKLFFLGEELHWKINNPLPKDSKIVQIGYDVYTNSLLAFIESKEFPEIGECETPEWYLFVVTDLSKGKE